MSYVQTRDEIYTRLSGVSGIGKVFKSRRYAQDWTTFLARFKDTGNKINVCWFWLNSAMEDAPKTGSENSEGSFIWTERDELWTIEMYYGFHDADDNSSPSEFAFQGLCETVETTFRFLQNLGGKAERSYPLERVSSGLAMLGDVLCHRAEFQLKVRRRM